ncbi:MAG: hypothetical protein ABH803_03015 [Candidatus Micrarchaeota archaeon]
MSIKNLLLSAFSPEELVSAITAKKEEYSGLLNDEGAMKILAREKNVSIPEEAVSFSNLASAKLGEAINVVLSFDKIYAEKAFETNGRKGRVCNVDVSSDGANAKLVLWNQDVSFLKKKGVEKNCVVNAKRLLVKSLEPFELHSALSTEMQLVSPGKTELVKLSEVTDGEVSVVCKVMDKSSLREFERNGRKSCVLNVAVSDDSGSSVLVCWGDNAVKANGFHLGQVIKVEDALVRNNELHCGWSTNLIPDYEAIISTKTTKLFEVEPGFKGIIEAGVRSVNEPKLIEKNGQNLLLVSVLLSDDKVRLPCVFFNEQARKFLGLKESLVDLKALFDFRKEALLEKKILFHATAKTNSFSGETELVCNSFIDFSS